MSDQRVLTRDEVIGLDPETTALWVTPSVRARVERLLPFPVLPALHPLPTSAKTLIVIGGGTIIDETKHWRMEQAADVELIAIPSIWGSGAEASPIAVRNRNGKKDIRIDAKMLPNARAIFPEFASSISSDRARHACGDTWAHALEGFLSPMATAELRVELSALITRMLATPIDNNPVWFELSAQACAGQARSSVGLVHGTAHTLEGIMQAKQPAVDWGHARLCSLFLWPVMRFNEQASNKWGDLLKQHGLSSEAILKVTQSFFSSEAYDQILPALKENWMLVLRDACTRTNSALARPGSLDFFVNKAFQ